MTATYAAVVDWLGDGDFADTGDVVTTRVRATPAVDVRFGRETGRALDPTSPGRGSLDLDNRSKDYSPDYASSPLYGLTGPGRNVLLTATLSATTYTLMRGIIDGYEVTPDRLSRKVSLTLADGLSLLVGNQISTPVYSGITTGQAINLVLDAANWPAAARDIDYGATCIPWWWEEGADAWDAIQRLVSSEGPPAFASIDGDGNFVFRGRHHRLIRTASITSQATFRDSGAEPRFSEPFTCDAGWSGVINSITFAVTTRQPSGTVDVVWSTDDVFILADGETQMVTASSGEPFVHAVTPVSGTDYVLTSGTVTVSLTRNSGAATTILITATGGPAVVTGMALRAAQVATIRTIQVHVEEGASITRCGRRSDSSIDAPWAGVWDALAVGETILSQRADRAPTVTITLKGANDTRLTQQLARDLSDRITIVEAQTGLNDDFHIGSIHHSIAWEDRLHTTQFGCEKAPDYPANVMILDTSVLNTGTLGSVGRDDPSTVMILDTDVLNTGFLGH
jgi:hypothetical protein